MASSSMFGGNFNPYMTPTGAKGMAYDTSYLDEFDPKAYKKYLEYFRKYGLGRDPAYGPANAQVLYTSGGGDPTGTSPTSAASSRYDIPGTEPNKAAYMKAYEQVRQEKLQEEMRQASQLANNNGMELSEGYMAKMLDLMLKPSNYNPASKGKPNVGPKSTEAERISQRAEDRDKKIIQLTSVVSDPMSTPGAKAQAEKALLSSDYQYTPLDIQNLRAKTEKTAAQADTAEAVAEGMPTRIEQEEEIRKQKIEKERRVNEAQREISDFISDPNIPASVKAELQTILGNVKSGIVSAADALGLARAKVSATSDENARKVNETIAKEERMKKSQIEREERAKAAQIEREGRAEVRTNQTKEQQYTRQDADRAFKELQDNNKEEADLNEQLAALKIYMNQASENGGSITLTGEHGNVQEWTTSDLDNVMRKIRARMLELANRNREIQPLADKRYTLSDVQSGATSSGSFDTNLYSPTTQEEYDAIPSGAKFIDPQDGKTYLKP